MDKNSGASFNPSVCRLIGLMSGTSYDGVDAALVEIAADTSRVSGPIERFIDSLKIRPLRHIHLGYAPRLREEISQAFNGDTAHICRLNFKLGECFARAAIRLMERAGIDRDQIDAIASHGQTIYHIPPSGKRMGSTLQIGEASVIAERTGILTISDFRTRDMATGGQGAPLVPVTDYIMFHKRDMVRVVLNIGGMANVSILRGGIEDTIAFDTGPGNALIDEAVRLYTEGREGYDRYGRLAKDGRPDKGLLRELSSHPFFKRPPPKSTGREVFGIEMVNQIKKRYPQLRKEDVIATLTHLTVSTIISSITPFMPDEVIATGGGTKNTYLVESLKAGLLRKGIKVTGIEEYGINAQEKEALSFAILGYLTLNRIPGNCPSATGANKNVILGKMTFP